MGHVQTKVADDARIRVEMNGLQPLIVTLDIQLPTDEITTVELEYLKLEKHYFTCFSLFHEKADCPSRPRNYVPPKDRKLGITQSIALQRIEADKKKHDDRRGYSRPQVNNRPCDRLEDSISRGPISTTNREHHFDREHFSNINSYRDDSHRDNHQRERSRNPNYSEADYSNKELSTGKIVSSRREPASPPLEGAL